LQEINKLKDLGLVTVTHDLRAPLNTTILHINLAKDFIQDEEARNSLSIAEKSCILMRFQISDILEFSHFQRNNKIRFNLEKFYLLKIVQDLKDLFSIQTK
jgi:signal transduction histidine kinase